MIDVTIDLGLTKEKKVKITRYTVDSKAASGFTVRDPPQVLALITSKFKGAFSDLRRFLATESLLKMMENVYYFT